METISNRQDNNISAGDHLANERTFLAWIRTSIALMGFGFVVVKFSLFLRQLSYVLGEKTVMPGKGYSPIVGIVLVIVGAITSVLAFLRYRNIRMRLIKGAYFPSLILTLIMTITILIVSVFLVLYLLPSI